MFNILHAVKLGIIMPIWISLLPFRGLSQDSCCWFLKDPQQDQVMGISRYRAMEYLKGRTSDTVVVAVIDNGAEITHKALKDVIWTNPREIPANGIDDDHNGYVDDIHGWNFLGNSRGQNLKRETTELTRTFGRLDEAFTADPNGMTSSEYALYQKVCREYTLEVNNTVDWLDKLKNQKNKLQSEGKAVPPALENKIKSLIEDLDTRLNPFCTNRSDIVGDNPDDMQDSLYGNPQVDACGPYHGTGVAGIIGAIKDKNGVEGVATKVRLMILRVVPNGDERDKDVARAILYAVRNGAAIINCSFAKKYSPQPEFVRLALREAAEKGVLIVHGAGNDMNNNDINPYYPDGRDDKGDIGPNWINVGASGQMYDESLIAYFSNYGKKTVDVFAPGEDIATCALNNGYSSGSGTSLAAPVVAGMAAVLKSFFPALTAVQLKQIILKSVIPAGELEVQPRLSDFERPVKVKELCVSGGIVNLWYAVLLAEKLQ